MAGIQHQLSTGAVPNQILNVCPPGTKFHLLETGWLECDEGYVIRSANSSLKSTEHNSFINKRRKLISYCVLIDHPHEGVILYDTGCGKDYPEVWGPIVADVFARVDYEPEKHDLEKAVVRAGYTLEQVKKVIISHLHVDHAGGLDVFMERKDVEVWVHELELKTAFWSVATGADVGTYLGHYLKLDLNWKTFDDSVLDFCQGITIHHTPGHTEGLVSLQINMPETGTFIFISDHCHVFENWVEGKPQGWLARDHTAWFRSTQRLKRLEKITRGQVISGHDKDTYLALKKQADVFT